MEEVSPIIRHSLPGKNLLINGGGVRENRQSLSNDVLFVEGGSSDIGNATTGSLRQSVSILAIAPTTSQPPVEATGATVFVGGTVSPGKSNANSPTTWRRTSIPEVQTVNGYGTKQQQLQSTPVLGQRHLHQQQQQQQQQQTQSAHHVVKIRINPELDTGRVISTVRLTPDQEDTTIPSKSSPIGKLIIENKVSSIDNDKSNDRLQSKSDDVARLSSHNFNDRASVDSCVRISVVNGKDNDNIDTRNRYNKIDNRDNPKLHEQRVDEMVQQRCTNESVNATSLNRTACFYYGSFQNQLTSMVMSSGQCSPSDTLDSGTCSDLDGTPPPLPKKKNSSTVLLGVNSNGSVGGSGMISQHNRTGSLTSSGAEVDSDDNESSISCDSLNSGELAARIAEQGLPINGTNPVGIVDKNSRSKNPAKDREIVKKDDEKLGKIGNEKTYDSIGTELDCYNINNNNNHSSNNKNNNNNVEELMNVNGKNNAGEAEMNERNNGNAASGSLPEMISNSCTTMVTSPCVSPSPSGASSLSKASSTPRVRSPVSGFSNGRVASPVVKECTYEERKREQDRIDEESAAADYYANYNRKNGTKYLYDDDRFYKFHINENQREDGDDDNKGAGDEKESDEYFAGYKILDREAIRSAKGTVRGVKNRVRAGIATFLQKPSTKNYKAKDEGKIVVYITSMSIVRETYFACIKMLQILKTHMVKYEVRDMFMSRELQTELKERIGCDSIEVPQLFIDGQYIGNADAVERLNESGELRRMFKPYKSPGACTTCVICGGCRLLPCTVCNGSKKSPVRNDFMKEFYWLRCMNCDEVGLVRCQHC